MKIDKYLDTFQTDSKCFLLLSITPKDKYPLKSYGDEFDNFVKNIFNNKEKYIGIFDSKRKEILQDVAFKLFTMPLIGDTYDLPNSITIKAPRATKEKLQAFIILKEFFDKVPFGEASEEEAIIVGKEKYKSFLEKYPIDECEITITKHNRYEDGVQYLIDMEFDFSEGYFFDKLYVY